MIDLVIVPDPAGMATAVSAWVAGAMTEDTASRGACSIGLAGGRTPEPVYGLLAGRADLPWSAVEVFFGDERAVPPDHPDSNYRLARSALLAHVAIPPEQVHRMEAERPDRMAAADAYARLLPETLDILLLGMGTDGHTASLFPGDTSVRERERLVLPVTGPESPNDRLTVTPPVIHAARRIGMMVTGAGKARMLASVLEGPRLPARMPAQFARRAGARWFVDQAAAASLRERSWA